jgi:uncharacterized protein
LTAPHTSPTRNQAAPQVGVLLGLVAVTVVLGALGVHLTLGIGLPPLFIGLALLGVLWAGHRGGAIPTALGLTTWTGRGVLLALLGATPMALGLDLPEVRGTPMGVYEALMAWFGSGRDGVGAAAAALLSGAVLAPIGEELLFRGYAVSRLREAGWSVRRAILVPGLVFGALHIPGALDSGLGNAAMSGLVTAMGGVWFGWLFLRWGRSLWVPLAAHAAMNMWWILGQVGPTAGSGGLAANVGRGVAIAIISIVTVRWTAGWGEDGQSGTPAP